MALIQKAEVIALVDGLKANVEALPEVNLGEQIELLQLQVASLQSQVDALNAKVVSAINVLQA